MKTVNVISTSVTNQGVSVRKTKIFYWIFTGLLIFMILPGAISNILMVPEAVVLFKHLGYPAYLLPFLGIAKVLGVIAILVPGFARLKEWAYAGFTYDLLGAMYSMIAVGDPAATWAPVLIGFLCIGGSYTLYHQQKAEKDKPKAIGVK